MLSKLALLVFVAVAFVGCAGCPVPPGEPGGGNKLVDCSIQGVRENALQAIPRVNDCLVGQDWTACLLGLIKPAIGITEDVIACVVQSSGASYSHAAQANASDVVSTRGAAHASQFLKDRGYTFKPAPVFGTGSAGGGGGGGSGR